MQIAIQQPVEKNSSFQVNLWALSDDDEDVDPTEAAADFDAAFHLLFPMARALAYRILGDYAEAEDAAAEALTRTLVAWKRVRSLPYRDAWVMRVTTNVAIDASRRARQRLHEPSTDPVPDPAESTAIRLALVAALAALPRRQREVIALQHLAGLRQADVARCMGLSLGSVKKHGNRALAALRRQLGESLGGAGEKGALGVEI